MTVDVKSPKKVKTSSTTAEHIEEYTNNSTIHGVRYLGERKRPLSEKIWWTIVFIASITFCTIFIREIYLKWRREPVIVSFGEKQTPIWDIPFPAVTICPEMKTRRGVFEFTKVYDFITNNTFNFQQNWTNITERNITDEEKFHLESLSHICIPDLFGNVTLDFFKEYEFKKYSTERNVEDIFNMSVPLTSSLIFSTFDTTDHEVDINSYLTSRGACYSFNLQNWKQIFKESAVQFGYEFVTKRNETKKYWNIDDGYSKESELDENLLDVSPVRPFRTGRAGGLKLLLKAAPDQINSRCQGFSMPGFKIILSSPSDFPNFGKTEFNFHLDKEVNVYIHPRHEKMDDSLKAYEPERRGCYLSTERNLKYFKIYTKSNCDLECLSNYTMTKCGCVKFSMPRDKDQPICGLLNIQCYAAAITEFERMILKGNKNEYVKGCDCLQGCNFVKYDYTYAETDFNISNFFSNVSALDMSPDERVTVLQIFFIEDDFIPMLRLPRYTFVDLISNTGGLLGLFMGVSILSIVEILYHFTLRLCCKLKNEEKKNPEVESKTNSEIYIQVNSEE